VVALTDHLIGCTAGTTLLSVGVATPSKAVPNRASGSSTPRLSFTVSRSPGQPGAAGA